jgi:formamidopyrimidine-DNA glycosylase
MPELPEVEVSRLGVSPHLQNQMITRVVIRNRNMRWPVPDEVMFAQGQMINSVTRRAKYLFLNTDVGSIVLHLGMSGRLRVVPEQTPVQKHDHIDIVVASGNCLRLNDPRRFGSCLWQGAEQPPLTLLNNLGPEPLTQDFDEQRLYQLSRGKSVPVKSFIMNNHTVVGVGNIYANEALFLSGIDPRRAAGKISRKRYQSLTMNIKQVLTAAIEQGGTTLKDFTQADGNPGYFSQHLRVYGRVGEECEKCQATIKSIVIGQRNTFYCPQCQR